MILPGRLLGLCACVGLLACGPSKLPGLTAGDDSSSGQETDPGTSDSSSSTNDEGGSESEADTDTDTDTDTSTSTTDGETSDTGPQCGDGVVDPDESCDDGNLVGGDGCPADCVIPPMLCGNHIYACGDTLDNDDDGWVDLYDPDCTSACDDDEGSFALDLPSQNPDCKYDCRWDDNEGMGDDMCQTNIKCDPLNPGEVIGCEYDPLFGQCVEQQGEVCLATCLPMAPNGCDCFGCCEIDGVFLYLGYGTSCSSADLDACLSCTPDPSCFNSCEPDSCELCMLELPAELPNDCPEPSCPEGVQPCTDPYACPDDFTCRTGCCTPMTIL